MQFPMLSCTFLLESLFTLTFAFFVTAFKIKSDCVNFSLIHTFTFITSGCFFMTAILFGCVCILLLLMTVMEVLGKRYVKKKGSITLDEKEVNGVESVPMTSDA